MSSKSNKLYHFYKENGVCTQCGKTPSLNSLLCLRCRKRKGQIDAISKRRQNLYKYVNKLTISEDEKKILKHYIKVLSSCYRAHAD